MKSIVRDDIISLDNYVACEFKYKPYIELLYQSGGYCFLDQFKKLIEGGTSIIKGMQEHNLVGLENINNCYKYIYLTDTATKYIELRESDKDYSDIKKNRIVAKKFKKNPTQKQLFISAFRFHLINSGDTKLIKSEVYDSFYTYILKNTFNQNINKISIDNFFESREEQIKNLNDLIDKKNIEVENYKKYFVSILKDIEVKEVRSNLNDLLIKKQQVEKEIEIISSKLIKQGLEQLKHTLQMIELEIQITQARNLEYSKIKVNQEEFMNPLNHEINELVKKRNDINSKITGVSNIIAEKVNPSFEELKRKITTLIDISKVIPRIKGDELEFNIFDCGNFSTGYVYAKHIKSLVLDKYPYKNIKVIIYSYADHRATNLLSELEKIQKDRAAAKTKVDKYLLFVQNHNGSVSETSPEYYKSSMKLLNDIPIFEIEVRDELFYINKYLNNISKVDRAIKQKDKKAIAELADKLKMI